MAKKEDAKRVLNHYIQMMMREQGLKTDSDTTAELDGIVDNIIDAAKEEILWELKGQGCNIVR